MSLRSENTSYNEMYLYGVPTCIAYAITQQKQGAPQMVWTSSSIWILMARSYNCTSEQQNFSFVETYQQSPAKANQYSSHLWTALFGAEAQFLHAAEGTYILMKIHQLQQGCISRFLRWYNFNSTRMIIREETCANGGYNWLTQHGKFVKFKQGRSHVHLTWCTGTRVQIKLQCCLLKLCLEILSPV